MVEDYTSQSQSEFDWYNPHRYIYFHQLWNQNQAVVELMANIFLYFRSFGQHRQWCCMCLWQSRLVVLLTINVVQWSSPFGSNLLSLRPTCLSNCGVDGISVRYFLISLDLFCAFLLCTVLVEPLLQITDLHSEMDCALLVSWWEFRFCRSLDI